MTNELPSFEFRKPAPKPKPKPPRKGYRTFVIAGLGVVVMGLVLFSLFNQKPSKKPVEQEQSQQEEKSGTLPPDPELPKTPLKSLFVYTSESGCVVFIDGEPARDEKGELLLSPCRLEVETGLHEVTVAKSGFAEATDSIKIVDEGELEFTLNPSTEKSILEGTWFQAELNKPFPIEFEGLSEIADPYLTPDGKMLWFVAKGTAGTGVYFAGRPSIHKDFGPPGFVLLTKQSDQSPASPITSSDQLRLAFSVPGKARVWGLSREDRVADFLGDRKLLFASDQYDSIPGAFLSGDFQTIVLAALKGEQLEILQGKRAALDQQFRELRPLKLPISFPRFSADFLRLFDYDGKTILRYWRSDHDNPFGPSEKIGSLEIEGYVSHPSSRQFTISEDEQWMFTANGPSKGSRIWAVRISERRAWGYIARGESISPKKSTPDEPMPEMVAEEPVVEEIPKSTLAYSAILNSLREKIKDRDYAQALTLLDQAKKEVEENGPSETREGTLQQLARDRADLVTLDEFWKVVDQKLSGWKSDKPVKLAGRNMEFLGYENGVVKARSKQNTIERPLTKIAASDIAFLFEGEQDEELVLSLAKFLYLDSAGTSTLAMGRLEKLGPGGEEFLELQAVRVEFQFELELNDQNLAAARSHLNQLKTKFAKTEIGKQSAAWTERLYSSLKWNRVGSRDWQKGTEGEFAADSKRENESLLVSSRKYKNFELELEWKTAPPLGQGGVYFRYPGDGPASENSFKIHLASDAGVNPDKFTTGSLFRVAAPVLNAVKPAGEWNTLQLRVEGEKVVVTINGKKALDTTASDPMIPSEGYIALDGAAGGITYRKIVLVELDGN